jgi:hypothetical protein
MKFYIPIILYIGVFNILCTCKSTNYKNLELKLNTSSESIAVYTIQESNFESILPKSLSEAAVRIENDIDFTPILRLISIRKNLLSSENWEILFSEEEIKDFKSLLSKAIQQQSAYAYLVLIKKEDPLSPLLKVLRSSYLIIKTEGGYILAIPDLNQNLTFATQYKFDDWTLYQIPKITSSKKQELKIKPNQIGFSIYRDIVGQEVRYYDRIMILNDKKYLPNPLLFKTPEPDDVPIKIQTQSVMERLTALEELKKKGMITEEEYKNKKTEILKDL